MLIALRSVAAIMMGLIGTAFVADSASAPTVGDQSSDAKIQEDRRFGTPPLMPEVVDPYSSVTWKHGDVSWLPRLAALAGWPESSLERLTFIVLRESGGCPYRRGGDVVNKNCDVVRVSEWNHRSDTGLLQINGVHWKQDHPQYVGLVCKKMHVCTQEELLDPITNLRAGKLLYDVAGWQPWTPIKQGK